MLLYPCNVVLNQKKDKRVKETAEEESSDGEAPDEDGDGEPVDAATLEAQVARLRELVVRILGLDTRDSSTLHFVCA